MNIISALPPVAQAHYRQVHDYVIKTSNEAVASRVAWESTKSKLRRVDGKLVANEEDFIIPVLYEFSMSPKGDSEIIFNEVDGELTVDAVLADTTTFTNPNGESRQFDEAALQELADQINKEGSVAPITNHDELKRLFIKHGGNSEAIVKEMKESRGIIKSIKAVVEKGKLWIRALLDKRYKNHAQKFKGVSLEAFGTPINGKLTKPKYVGFIFTDHPRMQNARVQQVV